MRLAILTDRPQNSPFYSKHVPVLSKIITDLGYKLEYYGVDQYFCNEKGVWTGPGLPEVSHKETKAKGLILNRTTSYGKYCYMIAKILENNNWVISDTPDKFKLAGDKWDSYLSLLNLPIPVIKTSLVSSYAYLPAPFPYPLVVKDRNGSSGREVHIVTNDIEYETSLNALRTRNNNGVVAQPLIKAGHPVKDLRVHVVFGEPELVLQRTAAPSSLYTNMAQGASVEEYDGNLLQQAHDIASKAAKHIKLDWCAIDLLITNDEQLILCEVNPSPGIYSTVKYLGEQPVKRIIQKLLLHYEEVL
jgi:glutathione synthase/RimK-type ligase-like ATP-grasp enzyme